MKTKSLYAMHQEIIDNRSSDQLMHDIKQANELRASAERLEIRGDSVSALLFRNAAWRLENGKEWLDDVNVLEFSR